jgi:4-amino-4-deoxy-L-arabinose transferase-like glycosyltransferase
MSKSHHRQHHSPAPARVVSAPLWDRIPHKSVIFSFFLAAIPFSMGKYFEFNTAGAFDSGAYMYSAKRVLGGAIPWVNEIVTAKAGTLLVNMLGISLFGYADHSAKIIQMLMQAAALITMFFVMRKIFGALAAGTTLFVASFYLSAPVIAKYGNVKEQYMIACMVLGISMLIVRQMGGAWWWGLLAGGFLAWGPMFKETAFSAIFATLIFLVLQPFLRNRSWKLTGADFSLLVLGAVMAIAPVSIWVAHIGAPAMFNPYVQLTNIAVNQAKSLLPHPANPSLISSPAHIADVGQPAPPKPKAKSSDYIIGAREIFGWAKQAPIVFRYYLVLILPVSLALGACVVRITRAVMSRLRKLPPEATMPYEKFVLLLGLWWFLDMALVWVSPRSWEEYYLPLCASGAMTGGYLVGLYCDKFRGVKDTPRWVWLGIAGLVCMIVMAWPVFFGLRTSPFSGTRYPSPSRGYVQKFAEVKEKAPWEEAAHYIRDNSSPADTIYVWGWFPGIYVESQRTSASTMPFTSEMHVMSPSALAGGARALVESFQKARPKFLVDTRKDDFPWGRPPLEFWPYIPQRGFLPNNPAVISVYETQWHQVLKENLDEDEADRFDAMKPLRDYVMANYEVVLKDRYRTVSQYGMVGPFGTHVLLVRKPSTP